MAFVRNSHLPLGDQSPKLTLSLWETDPQGFERTLSAESKKMLVTNTILLQDRQSKFRIGHHLRDIFSGKTELLGDIRLGISVKNENQVLHSTLVWDDALHLDHLNDLIFMNTVCSSSSN